MMPSAWSCVPNHQHNKNVLRKIKSCLTLQLTLCLIMAGHTVVDCQGLITCRGIYIQINYVMNNWVVLSFPYLYFDIPFSYFLTFYYLLFVKKIVIFVIFVCFGQFCTQSWWSRTCFQFIPPELLVFLTDLILGECCTRIAKCVLRNSELILLHGRQLCCGRLW